MRRAVCLYDVSSIQVEWLYRELNIKDKLNAGMSDAQSYELLATNGMLVKRPLLIGDGFVIPGFKEVQWLEALGLEEQE